MHINKQAFDSHDLQTKTYLECSENQSNISLKPKKLRFSINLEVISNDP